MVQIIHDRVSNMKLFNQIWLWHGTKLYLFPKETLQKLVILPDRVLTD